MDKNIITNNNANQYGPVELWSCFYLYGLCPLFGTQDLLYLYSKNGSIFFIYIVNILYMRKMVLFAYSID